MTFDTQLVDGDVTKSNKVLRSDKILRTIVTMYCETGLKIQRRTVSINAKPKDVKKRSKELFINYTLSRISYT